MAQIGEFAFIVAALGLSLGVISEFLFPIAVGVSAITTFTTPYLIKLSEPLYNGIVKILPVKWIVYLDAYTSETQKIKHDPIWRQILRQYYRILATNSIILIAIVLLFKYTFIPFLDTQLESVLWRNVILISTATVLASPFLWAILIRKVNLKEDGEIVDSYSLNYSVTGISLNAIRYLLGIFLIGFFIDQITTTRYALITAVPVIVAFLCIFSDKVQKVYQRIEQQFLSNLNERERLEYIKNTASRDLHHKNEEVKKQLQEWNAYVTELEAGDTIFFAGMTLHELNWKQKYGINIVYIRRNDRTIHLPNGKQRILIYDKVGILGTEEQIAQLKLLFDQTNRQVNNEEDIDINDIRLIKARITDVHPYSGKTITDTGIRKDLRSHVVGIERNGNRILNPNSSQILLVNDIIWLVGDAHKIEARFKNYLESHEEV